MIAQLTGTIVRSDASSVVIDVNGVGYFVSVPASVLHNLPPSGEKMTLATHLVTRGQPDFEMSLYGFREVAELQAFRMLINVSGVGPRVALAVLSNLEVSELARALSTNDTRAITKVPGVGPKLAQKLCLELGDKMAEFTFTQRAERATETKQTADENAAYEDAIEGLMGLGYSRPDARRAVDRAFANTANKSDASALITASLSLLNAKR